MYENSNKQPYDLKVVYMYKTNLSKQVLNQYKTKYGFGETSFINRPDPKRGKYKDVFKEAPDYWNFSDLATEQTDSNISEFRRNRIYG